MVDRQGRDEVIEEHVAIQGVCAWPNLQRLPDGSLVVLVFNQPCHGLWEGDLDCWASEDEGRTWRFRGRAAEHEPGTNRMNCAAGLAKDGDLVVICGGWSDRGPVGQPSWGPRRVLRPWVCRSADGGRTWQVRKEFPDPPSGARVKAEAFICFGNIVPGADGSLRVAAYLRKDGGRECYLLRSVDDGRTWGQPVILNPVGNETCVLHLGGGRWLASSRELAENKTANIVLCTSEDDGLTWQRRGPVTLANQVTSHLMRLRDGRVLLSYGNRNWGNFGVDVRLSDDEGRSWGGPIRIAGARWADCGYPSSVQLADGRVVTAYYTKVSHDFHYEMRVAVWRPEDFATTGRPIAER
ncbi:MAG: sialidase family protein [Phycisphaerae bacterium]